MNEVGKLSASGRNGPRKIIGRFAAAKKKLNVGIVMGCVPSGVRDIVVATVEV